MTKRYTYLLLITLISNVIFAQSLKEKTADKFFNALSYAKAADFYKELATEKKASSRNIRRAAECYKNLNDFKNAECFYEKLASTIDFNSDDAYQYSQVLKSLGNYKKADKYLEEISASNPYAAITKRHQQYKDYHIFLKVDSANYVLKNSDISSEESDFSPFIYNNDFYFTSSRRNVSAVNKTFAWDESFFLDQYVCKYENGNFSEVKAMSSAIDSKYHEGPGIISADGNTLFLTRNNYLDKKLGKDIKKQINLKIYVSKKDDKGNWGKFENFPFNSDEYSIGHPAISKDGQTIYFVSDMPGGFGQTDIYETHQENGTWSKPTNLGEAINSPGKEMFPTVFNDGTLFYSSDGNAGLGGLDIYMSTPQNKRFNSIQNLGYPLNSNADDFSLLLNSDFKSGFMSSNRAGGKGYDDIYSFVSSKEIIPQFTINGIVRNKLSKEPISNSNVDLYDESGIILKSIKTNDKGYFEFPLSANKSYTLEAVKDEYSKDILSVNTNDVSNKKLNSDLLLQPSGVFALAGIVTNGKTKEPINNVAVLIKNKLTGEEVLKTLTTQVGDFDKILGALIPGTVLDYDIQLQKDGFITKTISFNQIVVKPTIFKINELIDMTLTPNGQGSETTPSEADMFVLNPIYFDLNKFNIRDDAQKELNNVIENLKVRKNIVIEIVAHTDCRGSITYNMLLSKRRAIATANYLKSKGVSEKQFKIKYVGENQLTTNCPCDIKSTDTCSEEDHQKNRRASFNVIKAKVSNKGVINH
jgi:outer membrane protein OmpA-like peptidoglycan-associated protein